MPHPSILPISLSGGAKIYRQKLMCKYFFKNFCSFFTKYKDFVGVYLYKYINI